MNDLLDKVIVSFIGIISALITNHFTKVIRENKNNIFEGCSHLEKQIREKYILEYKREIEITFFPLNLATLNFLKKNKILNEVNYYLKKNYDNYYVAKQEGDELIKKINDSGRKQ